MSNTVETMQILHACAVRRWKRRAAWLACATVVLVAVAVLVLLTA